LASGLAFKTFGLKISLSAWEIDSVGRVDEGFVWEG